VLRMSSQVVIHMCHPCYSNPSDKLPLWYLPKFLILNTGFSSGRKSLALGLSVFDINAVQLVLFEDRYPTRMWITGANSMKEDRWPQPSFKL
jgi:hypothetical protein